MAEAGPPAPGSDGENEADGAPEDDSTQSGGGDSSEEAEITLRTEFPETWLWLDATTGYIV